MTTTHLRAIPAALLMALAALVVLASCQSDDAAVATASDESSERSPEATAVASAVAPDAIAGDVVSEVVDLTDVVPADAEAAGSVLELAARAEEPHEMAAGAWFSSSFSEPVAFDLVEPGRLVDVGLGWTTIEAGEPDTDTHGLLRIVEVVALASPDGPVPISLVGPDAEFADTELLRRGTARVSDRALSWRDVVMLGELIPERFTKACGFDPAATCVDALIAEGGPVILEVDRPSRFVVQPFGSRKLYVVATSLGTDHDAVFDQAFHIAASVVTTDRTEDAIRQPLATLGLRADSIPAGIWFVPMGGVTAELDLVQDAAGVSILDTGTTWFALQATSGDGEHMIFSAQVFQGFPAGALEGDDANAELPLPADVFLRGMGAIAPLDERGSATIAGFASEYYQVGSPESDSPFACQAFERADLAPDETCAVFSTDGWRIVDSPDRTFGYQHHYVEELGVIIAYPGVAGPDGFDIDPQFDSVLEALTLADLAES